MQFMIQGVGLGSEIVRAERVAQDCLAAMQDCVEQIRNGSKTYPSGMRAYQYALHALNCQGGIICGPIEMLKYEFPRKSDESALDALRNVLKGFKEFAILVLRLLGMKDPELTMRHYSCKFRELFTVGWLEKKQYSERKRERVLDAASRCARKFLVFLARLLQQFEEEFVVNDMREIEIGAYAKSFVLFCSRREGVVLMRDANQRLMTFEMSPQAKLAWRIIRALISCKGDGAVMLPSSPLAQFRNTDNDNALKVNGLYEFSRYIHSTGNQGEYQLRPFQKRRNEH